MIKLIKEYFKTGIEAHKAQLESINRSRRLTELAIQGWEKAIENSAHCAMWNNHDSYLKTQQSEYTIERLEKKKRRTAEENETLLIQKLMREYRETHNIK